MRMAGNSGAYDFNRNVVTSESKRSTFILILSKCVTRSCSDSKHVSNGKNCCDTCTKLRNQIIASSISEKQVNWWKHVIYTDSTPQNSIRSTWICPNHFRKSF